MAEVLPEPGFDMAEAAAIAGLNRTYLYYLASENKLPTFKGKTGKTKVSRFDLQMFMRDRERERSNKNN